MVRRSVLFSPGDEPEKMWKALETAADVIVFDLEDAVSPERKREAREAVRSVLLDSDFDPPCEVCVRVNAAIDEIREDVAVICEPGADELRLDSVMVPKAQSTDHLVTVDNTLERYFDSVPLFALIETASGVLGAHEIATLSSVVALVFGAEDFAADVGAKRTASGTEVLYARERVVVAAAANGCDAIDTVYTDFSDVAGLKEDTMFAAQLGYDGKLAIHPAQIDPINEAFAPDADDVAWAERIMEAKRSADDDSRGVFEVDGEMVDAPVIERAERILSLAATDRRDERNR